MQSPREAAVFKRYRLNIWSHSAGGWLSLPHWGKCSERYIEDDLEGESCVLGVDMASTDDFTALLAWFPRQQRTLAYFWCPEVRVRYREQHGEGYYTDWVRGGHMIASPGD